MAGIYLHIPFCSKKCGYCDFYSVTQILYKKDFIKALVFEIESRKNEFEDELINTIYFGGGTPSLLSKSDFEIIFKTLNENYKISDVKEITIEVNPDDITKEYLTMLLEVGFNRLSMGIQSFDDKILKFMNRRHNAQQAIRAVNLAQDLGFSNISIDLIYGVPGMNFTTWVLSLDKALSLSVQHISAYHLTFEKGTPFYYHLRSGKIKEINDDESEKQFQILIKKIIEAGYIDYEISNFCLPGYESKHNSSYWTGTKYIGFGPSAHSFNGIIRRWNNSDISKYNKHPNFNEVIFEEEILSEKDKYNEQIMLGLRTKKGVNINKIITSYSEKIVTFFNYELQEQIKNGKVQLHDDYVMVSADNKLITDQIISEFFIL